jgi:hypothetical protein
VGRIQGSLGRVQGLEDRVQKTGRYNGSFLSDLRPLTYDLRPISEQALHFCPPFGDIGNRYDFGK